MNGIIIEVEGYPKTPEPPSDEQKVESPLLEKMKRAYVELFQTEYEPKLSKDRNDEAIYPQFTVVIDEEDNEIIFDSDLFKQLCEIYMLKGWDGITEVEKKVGKIIEEIKKADPIKPNWMQNIKWDKDVLPQKVNSWNLVSVFFTFTQKMLALLIRETLANIEKRSAEQIIAKLSIANIEVAKAFRKYQIRGKKEKQEQRPSFDTPAKEVEITTYSIGEPKLAEELFKLLKNAVNDKYLYDLSLKKLNFLPTAIKEANSRSNEPNSFTSDPVFRNTQRIRAEEMEKDLPKYSALKESSEKLLKTSLDLLKAKHPLGLLIYPSLEKGFEQPKMENQFGLTLTKLREEDFESLAKKIDPQVSKVEQLLPFKQTGDTRRDIFSFNIPKGNIEKGEKGGIENFVLKISLGNYQDSAFFPLLAEENLNQLFDKEIFPTDSFESVVGFHYRLALIKNFGEIKKAEKEREDFWKTISKISSGLSLASLFLPFLRGVALIVDLTLLAHTIESVTDGLKRNDELLKETLVNQDDYSTESLARLGEVISIRKEFQENLTEQLAIEIFNIIVGGKLPVFKEFLLLRGYYYDIETLFETENETQ